MAGGLEATVTQGAAAGGPDQRPQRLGLKEHLAIIRSSAIIREGLTIEQPIYEPQEFAGKRAFITGVSHTTGFGFHTAMRLVEMGAGAVAFNYREHTEEVDQVIASLEQAAAQTGTRIIPIQADISQLDQVEGLVDRVVAATATEDAEGGLDIYVDNAGVVAMGMLHEQTTEQAIADLNVNVIAPQLILGQVAKQMASQKTGGRVVSLSSVVADGAPNQTRYAGPKALRHGVVRSAQMESLLKLRGKITYAAIAPGLSPTQLASAVPEEARPGLINMIGQEAEIQPSAVAEYILFALSSHLPRELYGQTIPALTPMLAPGTLAQREAEAAVPLEGPVFPGIGY